MGLDAQIEFGIPSCGKIALPFEPRLEGNLLILKGERKQEKEEDRAT